MKGLRLNQEAIKYFNWCPQIFIFKAHLQKTNYMEVYFKEKWFRITDISSTTLNPQIVDVEYDFGNGDKKAKVLTFIDQPRTVELEEDETSVTSKDILEGVDFLLRLSN
jgi:hypothetical protein